MEQKEVLKILSEPQISQYLDDISKIHIYTKHYLLMAEELSTQGVTFLQPLKEHRDAYDHLMRVFGLTHKKEFDNFEVKEYIMDNIKKALGHEYRAFFDTADWFTYICRNYIRETLSYRAKRKAYSKLYDYEKTKDFINNLPFKIAEYRENKDVSKKKNSSEIDEVLNYKETMDKLLEIYKQVQSL